MHCFTITIPPQFEPADWRIGKLSQPRCTGVAFGQYVLLFPPPPGDLHFYDRLEAHIRGGAKGEKTTMTDALTLEGRTPLFGYPREPEESLVLD